MTESKVEAPPLSRAAIIKVAAQFRDMFGLDDPYLPAERVIEHLMPAAMPGFEYEVLGHGEMGNRHGYWDPMSRTLALREDVYEGLVKQNRRDRFTAMHEAGHAILHRGQLNRSMGGAIPAYRDPEWQANTFAAAILMPPKLVAACRSIKEVISEFGVTPDAARVWVRLAGVPLKK